MPIVLEILFSHYTLLQVPLSRAGHGSGQKFGVQSPHPIEENTEVGRIEVSGRIRYGEGCPSQKTRALGEHCGLPQRGPGQSTGQKRIRWSAAGAV